MLTPEPAHLVNICSNMANVFFPKCFALYISTSAQCACKMLPMV